MAAARAGRFVSVFDVQSDLFNSARILRSHPSATRVSVSDGKDLPEVNDVSSAEEKPAAVSGSMWTCHLCRGEFESLQDQRTHFRSDLHRLNVKLSIAGKSTIREEDFDDSTCDLYFDNSDISSISGSEDELEDRHASVKELSEKNKEEFRKRLFFQLHSGEVVSLWRCLLLSASEEPPFNTNASQVESGMSSFSVEDGELIRRLMNITREPRDRMHLRIVLLISGGHFAGCVFDGNAVVAHKTFHRYVVRAKAGRKQSAQDGTGKVAHSAGSSLRRYNEAALKKDIQELIASWKSYFDSSMCVFIYAPSRNRQIFFDGGRTQGCFINCNICQVPMTCHRPTLKEAKRIYNLLTQITFETEDNAALDASTSDGNEKINTEGTNSTLTVENAESSCAIQCNVENISSKLEETDLTSSEDERETTLLHEAAKVGDALRVLELLELGSNPCVRDQRGKTPYMLATDKEVRNTFRRYMALNLDKWDWHEASVPSALTKELEESQAAKQAEKDAKRKAKAKELKKLKKAKEKEKAKAQAQASQMQPAPAEAPAPRSVAPRPPLVQQRTFLPRVISEEERQRSLAEEREKRAAAAERRMAALSASGSTAANPPTSHGGAAGITCSCCNASLESKVPFHRYNYKYCSPSCMHVHREMLEDG